MAGYRAKYGGSLLRKVPEQVAKQELFEKEQSTKHEIAKKRRAEEKARLDEIQVSRSYFHLFGTNVFVPQRQRVEAEKARLAEEEAIRERQREEARSWRQEIRQQEEEEGIKKQERAEGRARSRKDREPAGSGEEAERKPRRKSKKKAKRGSDDEMIDDEEEANAMHTDDEEAEVRARSKVSNLFPFIEYELTRLDRHPSRRRSVLRLSILMEMMRVKTDQRKRRNCESIVLQRSLDLMSEFCSKSVAVLSDTDEE
jgi:RNA polymerase-associated protein CTR9